MSTSPVSRFRQALASPILRVDALRPRPALGSRSDRAVRDFARRFAAVRDGLSSLASAAGLRHFGTGFSAGGAATVAGTGLGLGAATAASLVSLGELNPAATSSGPTNPEFAGASTASVTLGGTYDGSQGTDTLTFVVKKPGQVGVRDALIDVYDSNGVKVDKFRVDKNKPEGTVYRLDNGLELTFSPGSLQRDDTFTVEVSDSPVFDPTAPFDGVGASAPGFADGVVVTDGSFTINGETIQVSGSDTLLAVLQRITGSGAGVTATYDASSERVRLVQDTPGSEPTIELGGDTSGFLEAARLAGAALTPGTSGDEDSVLSALGAFASVRRGSLSIGGTAIAIDPASDTLRDVLDRINRAGLGVAASLDRAGGRIVLTSLDPGRAVALSDDSGFLAAAGIEEQSLGGGREGTRRRVNVADEKELRAGLYELTRELRGLRSSGSGTRLDRLRSDSLAALEDAVREALREPGEERPESDVVRTGFGLTFRFGEDELLEIDASRLRKALREDPERISRFLLGDGTDEHPGLLEALDGAVSELGGRLAAALDPVADVGLILDLRS